MTDPYLDLESARWARARDDYRAGLSAAEVCARHGLARSTFHARAHAERWRRCDLAASADTLAPPPADDFDPSADRRSAFEMADLAHRRLSHAVETGRLREALGWARLAREMRELTPEEEEGRSWRRVRREQLAAAPAADPSPAVHHPVGQPPPVPVSASTAAHAAPSQSLATAGGASTPDAEAFALAGEAFVGTESERPSPAGNGAQTAEPLKETPLTLDSPDTYDALDAVLPPELFAELLQDMSALRSGDPAHADDWAAWKGMQRKLKAARPDLSWWSGSGDEDQALEEEAPHDFILPAEGGEVAPEASEGPRGSAEDGGFSACDLPLVLRPSGPLPPLGRTPPSAMGEMDHGSGEAGGDPPAFTTPRDASPLATGQAPIPLECAAARATLALEP